MTESMPDSGVNEICDVRTVTVNLPAGKVAFPAWVASGFIESIFKHDREVYGRHMIAVQAGETPAAKPGRKKAGAS